MNERAMHTIVTDIRLAKALDMFLSLYLNGDEVLKALASDDVAIMISIIPTPPVDGECCFMTAANDPDQPIAQVHGPNCPLTQELLSHRGEDEFDVAQCEAFKGGAVRAYALLGTPVVVNPMWEPPYFLRLHSISNPNYN